LTHVSSSASSLLSVSTALNGLTTATAVHRGPLAGLLTTAALGSCGPAEGLCSPGDGHGGPVDVLTTANVGHSGAAGRHSGLAEGLCSTAEVLTTATVGLCDPATGPCGPTDGHCGPVDVLTTATAVHCGPAVYGGWYAAAGGVCGGSPSLPGEAGRVMDHCTSDESVDVTLTAGLQRVTVVKPSSDCDEEAVTRDSLLTNRQTDRHITLNSTKQHLTVTNTI